jgi:hypothetical protein
MQARVPRTQLSIVLAPPPPPELFKQYLYLTLRKLNKTGLYQQLSKNKATPPTGTLEPRSNWFNGGPSPLTAGGVQEACLMSAREGGCGTTR